MRSPSCVGNLDAASRSRSTPWSRKEWGLLVGVVALVLLAMLGPHIGDSPHQHHFADQRVLWGIPCALDVLSNLPFAVLGAWGLVVLYRGGHFDRARREALGGAHSRSGTLSGALLPLQPLCAAWRVSATVFFMGLLCTALGSSWYHWQPDAQGLLWDRMGMAVAFTGLLAVAISGRISARAGWAALALLSLAAPAAVLWWAHSHNVLPWAVVQLGGMLVVLVLACMPRVPVVNSMSTIPVLNLWAVIGWYALAKVAEGTDHWVFAATGQWVSGHTLKHILAAGAAVPVVVALVRWQRARAAVAEQMH